MTVTFRCGHRQTVPETAQAAPRCQVCGETVVSRVEARHPQFLGHCRGPFAVFQALDAGPVDLRPVKEQTHG